MNRFLGFFLFGATVLAGCSGSTAPTTSSSTTSSGTSSTSSSTGSTASSTGSGSTGSASSASSSSGGSVQVSVLAGNGNFGDVNGFDGPDGGVSFGGAGQLSIDASGNIYVADIAFVREIKTNGLVTTPAGNGTYGFHDGIGGPNGAAEFDQITSVAVGPDGSVYIADEENARIRKLDTQLNVTTFAGNGTYAMVDGTGGPNGTAEFCAPVGVAVDVSGNVYVADSLCHSVRKIDPDGNVTTLAGSDTNFNGDVDGTGGRDGTAGFSGPAGVAVDLEGNVYVADADWIRKISTDGNVTTVAGSSACGTSDGSGGRSGTGQLCGPSAIAIDSRGNLIIADTFNYMIRQIDPDGNVTTVAGDGHSGFENGPGASAEFERPSGVAVNAAGDIIVGDYNLIRKIVRSP